MATSIGDLAAFLTLNTEGFSRGAQKVAREEKAMFAEMEATARKSMDQIRKELGSLPSMARLAQKQMGVSIARASGGLGQGMGGLSTRVMSRAEMGQALAAGSGGGILSGVSPVVDSFIQAKVGLQGLNSVLKGTLSIAKMLSGEFKDWGSFASDAARMLPVVGETVSKILDWARGADLKEEADKRLKGESANRARLITERAGMVKDLAAGIARAQDDARLAGMTGVERKLEENEIARRNAQQRLRDKYGDAARVSASVQQALTKAIAAEEVKYEARRIQILKEADQERQKELRAAEIEGAVKRAILAGDEAGAKILQIKADYAEKILAAEEKHNDALARQLTINRDLAIEEVVKAEAKRKQERMDRTSAEFAQWRKETEKSIAEDEAIAVDIQARKLEQVGKKGQAALLRKQQEYAEKIKEAVRGTDWGRASLLVEQGGLELGALAKYAANQQAGTKFGSYAAGTMSFEGAGIARQSAEQQLVNYTKQMVDLLMRLVEQSRNPVPVE